MTDHADCRGIWAALESGKPVTLDDLQIVADVLPADSADYLQTLIAHEYVRLSGVRQAGSGEALPVFRLAKLTGPEAPYVDEQGKLIDPNLPAERGHSGKFAAYVRLAAERMPGPFTSAELKAQLSGWRETRTRKFDSVLGQLKQTGELIRDEMEYPGARRCWIYRQRPQVDRIRHYMRHTGGTFDSTQLSDIEPGCNGLRIRQALEMLTAEGYEITVTPVNYRVTRYLVQGPVGAGPRACPGGEPQCE